MTDKKSPLKGRPLRQAGQSVQEEIDSLVDDKLFLYFVISWFLLALVAFEWYRWHMSISPRPWVMTFVNVPVVTYFLYKGIPIWKRLKSLKLGRDGEKVVGEYLEHLRLDGCIVFHDIIGDKFNIDHVVLSSRGIYVIETKTYSKPGKKESRIQYDGTHLFVDGLGNKDDILIQIEAESRWLKDMLKESTGRDFDIKPVVVFPGWYVESKNHNKNWVINPKALPKFIQSQNQTLSKEDFKLAAYHLSRYIRSL